MVATLGTVVIGVVIGEFISMTWCEWVVRAGAGDVNFPVGYGCVRFSCRVGVEGVARVVGHS
ncbi:hypothetical protein [Actinokineospora diospyrosa]|uniref:hypothetical protein n=1 Tax=Actinokineospora diospyrosa TaxID=103728 RepID=UPI0020A39DBB|nr:hypothetical protein [Actinokineospora diospyrosa]